jgi:CheY-like chemotaxis protein
MQSQLAGITRRLKVIGAVAIEQDADIAECLRHGVVDALTTQIERMSRLSASVAGYAP